MPANDNMPSHYQSETTVEAHWDRMWKLYREAWFVGNITKYVERYRKKDGLKDLEKAAHYLQKLLELEQADQSKKRQELGEEGEYDAEEVERDRYYD